MIHFSHNIAVLRNIVSDSDSLEKVKVNSVCLLDMTFVCLCRIYHVAIWISICATIYKYIDDSSKREWKTRSELPPPPSDTKATPKFTSYVVFSLLLFAWNPERGACQISYFFLLTILSSHPLTARSSASSHFEVAWEVWSSSSSFRFNPILTHCLDHMD